MASEKTVKHAPKYCGSAEIGACFYEWFNPFIIYGLICGVNPSTYIYIFLITLASVDM